MTVATADTKAGLAGALRLYPFDRLVIGYCLLMALILAALGRPLGEYVNEITFYVSMAAAAALVIYLAGEKRSRTARFFRLLYPAMMLTFFYRATGGMMFLVHDGFLDWQLTAFEKGVFGTYPTIFIDRYLLNVWVNELLSFAYVSYYLMIPVFLLVLFFRKEYEIIKSFLTASCLTFFISYLLFFLYPLEGPRWHFAAQYVNEIEGPVFRKLTEFAIAKGAVRGGCMPSSHFGVAWVILMYTYRYHARATWWLGPLVIGLGIGTVWGRFHYVSDVIVGGVIGLVSVLAVWKLYTINSDRFNNARKTEELTTENVS